MRILHIGNPANVAWTLAQAQKELGHKADVLIPHPNKFGYPYDFALLMQGTNLSSLKNALRIANAASEYDIVHHHGGLTKNRIDALLIHYLNRVPMVLHYHGHDLISGEGRHYKGIAKKRLVARPDLLKFMPDAKFIPNPLDIAQFEFKVNHDHDVPVVLHMPSNREKKGTDEILQSICAMKGFEFKLVEKVPREQALREILDADIVIDDIRSGMHNIASLEAMACGKIAIARVDETNLAYYPDYAGYPWRGDIRATLKGAIEVWHIEKEYWGENGRKYVEKNHCPSKIAERHLDIYKEVLDGKH
jgi:glycosyltransferase involved in cell wall biosynthesis